jgi:dynein regulatory complex protein 1
LIAKCLNLLSVLQGFLIESKLAKLLSPLERDERSLMKLDAIFTVSGTFPGYHSS